jgi:AcrR family transcriptional regulator
MSLEKSSIQLRVEADLKQGLMYHDVAARRLRILAGAIQECSEIGFKNATISGVARRAGVSTATLYKEYKDKTDLFFQSAAYIISLLAESMTMIEDAGDPFERVKGMLINHGRAMGDPFMSWLYRMYVSASGYENYAQLSNIARAGRDFTQAHWQTHLLLLEQEGHIHPSQHDQTINLLLGQIERRTILAQLLFGQEDKAAPSLYEAAHFATTALFANLGTQAFHQSHPQRAFADQ